MLAAGTTAPVIATGAPSPGPGAMGPDGALGVDGAPNDLIFAGADGYLEAMARDPDSDTFIPVELGASMVVQQLAIADLDGDARRVAMVALQDQRGRSGAVRRSQAHDRRTCL